MQCSITIDLVITAMLPMIAMIKLKEQTKHSIN